MFIKNIVKYIFILAAIAIGVVVIACAVMMFVPSVSILGYRYVSVNEKQDVILHSWSVQPTYVENIDKVTEIEVDAQNMNVLVYPTMHDISSRGYFEVYSLIQGNGFCKTGKDKKEISDLFHTFKPELVPINDNAYKLVIKSVTTDGFINLTHHRLEIGVPSDLGNNLNNLKVTTKAGNITIRKDATNNHNINDAVLNVSGLSSFESTSGSITLMDLKVNNLKAKSTYGEMNFRSGLLNTDGGTTLQGTVMLENEFGHINFEEGVNLKAIKITSGISRVKLNDITDTFEYEGDSAYLSVGKVTGGVTIRSIDAIVNIKEVSKTSTTNSESRFYITSLLPEGHNSLGNLSFNIGKIEASEIDLRTNGGAISINELITINAFNNTTRCNIESNTGNITIKKLTGSANIVTTRGNVKVNQAPLDGIADSTLRNSTLTIKAKHGNIVLKNIVCKLDLTVPSGGNAPIDITMPEVNADSKIFAQKGIMNLHLPFDVNDSYNIAFFKEVDGTKTTASASINIEQLSPFIKSNHLANKNNYFYIPGNGSEYSGAEKMNGRPTLYIYSTGNIVLDSNIPSEEE